MRAMLDACVLYPTVMREVLIGCARAGLYTPLWTARILEEWARAVARNLPDEAQTARVEIALLRAGFPAAEVAPGDLAGLRLPDPDDVHVLAAAISAKADLIVTLNRADFPDRALAPFGLRRRDPDLYLLELHAGDADAVLGVCEDVRRRAETLSGEDWPMRRLLKKARLPRLGKALG